MTHDPPPRDDPADGQVRNALWRLRARLVTPPDHLRAEDDLQRIVAAAQLHAHDTPLGTLEPQPAVEESPVLLAAEASVHHLPPRWLAAHRIGRVAAVVVLVAGVGGGIANVRDGGSIASLLRLGATDDVEVVAGSPLSSPDVEVARDTATGDNAAPSVVPVPQEDPAPQHDAPAERPDAGEQATATAPTTDATDSSSEAAAPVPPDTSDTSEPVAPPSAPAPKPQPEPEPDPESEPAPVDEEPVLAAPDPGQVDGAGGAIPCPDGEICLIEAEPDDGLHGDADRDGDASTSEDPAEQVENLAGRRFQPPAVDGSQVGDQTDADAQTDTEPTGTGAGSTDAE